MKLIQGFTISFPLRKLHVFIRRRNNVVEARRRGEVMTKLEKIIQCQ